jgi:hypothetical protein
VFPGGFSASPFPSGGHLDLPPKNSRAKPDDGYTMKICTVPHNYWMRFYMDNSIHPGAPDSHQARPSPAIRKNCPSSIPRGVDTSILRVFRIVPLSQEAPERLFHSHLSRPPYGCGSMMRYPDCDSWCTEKREPDM